MKRLVLKKERHLIKVAKTAGFCFGVNRAIKKVNELLLEGKKVYTLGPIIHNPPVVKSLADRGVVVAHSLDDVIEKDAVLVIRSHGVPLKVIQKIQEKNISCINETCPFVSKIHNIVYKASTSGKTILIAGDENHSEIKGIRGHCMGDNYVFDGLNSLESLFKENDFLRELDLAIVAQTTFNRFEWENCLKLVKKVCTNLVIFDTICNATLERQLEAEKLSKECAAMIVIGGKDSSNTAKLVDICSQNCKSYFIEAKEELPIDDILKADSIGITAGASTPANIIGEVINIMNEFLENETQDEGESSFEQMLEESLKGLNTDEKVRGIVVGIAPNEVYVDVGRKQAGFIPLAELSNDPNVQPEDVVKIGDELELLIMKTNDQEGTIMLSKKRIDSFKGWQKIVEANETQEVLTGVVTNIVKGGLIALTNGVRVFIPASLAMERRDENIEDLLKQQVSFRIIEINNQRKRAVGSVKSVKNDEKKQLAEKFWESAELGKKYQGEVKSITNYGAFVDLGGIDGMIHISDLSWNRIKHPSEILNVGDVVEVYIKDLDKEKGRIALGYKKTEDSPWEILRGDYAPGMIVEAQVVGMTAFGAFARIIPGVEGLIHISQITDRRIDKPQDALSVGETVKVLIKDIDFDKKRISLSINEAKEAESNLNETFIEETVQADTQSE